MFRRHPAPVHYVFHFLFATLFVLSLVQKSRGQMLHSNVLAFGSCAKQNEPQPFWHDILKLKPDAWLWTGDAIYPNCSNPECLRMGYETLRSKPEYKNFKTHVSVIDGTWDDHDYGLNDGGKKFQYKKESQSLFLDFLDVPKESPRRQRLGVYTSRLFTLNDSSHQPHSKPRHIKVILLDIRSHREQPFLPSLGQYPWIPFSSIMAAGLRLLTSLVGLGWDDSADVLGEEQWNWLEQELQSSHTGEEATIIVSSMQVMTTIPIFESWGHFPRSRRRLFELIQRIQPPGVIFISGDVHLGQISGDPNCVVEYTSSGLTHSILSHPFMSSVLTDVIFPLFQKKKLTVAPRAPSNGVSKRNRQFYEGRNFGTIQFVPDMDGGHNLALVGTIHDIDGRPKLRVLQKFGKRSNYSCLDQFPPLIPKRTHLGFLLFLLIDIFLIASGIGVVWCIVGIYYISIRRLIRIMNQSRMEKKRTHHVEQSSATQSISELKEATLSSNLGHEVQRSEGTIKKRNKK